MGDFYTFERVELVRIGQGKARILGIDAKRIDYTNEAGTALHIDLEECCGMFNALEAAGGIPPRNESDWAAAWDALPEASRSTGGYSIGMRARMDDPPWFQFCNRRRTQFEFADSDEMNALLLDPLNKSGAPNGSFDCS